MPDPPPTKAHIAHSSPRVLPRTQRTRERRREPASRAIAGDATTRRKSRRVSHTAAASKPSANSGAPAPATAATPAPLSPCCSSPPPPCLPNRSATRWSTAMPPPLACARAQATAAASHDTPKRPTAAFLTSRANNPPASSDGGEVERGGRGGDDG
uniref:Uncharacterized protein n=1 Tax=Zea mays TaxID=4577 RepID=C0HG74_MAIZE|nr:unknown [Zea mays]